MALLPNAKDYYATRARNVKMQQLRDYYLGLGIGTVSLVDLNEYHTANELHAVLEQCDVIWASGGNTFCLRYAMEQSGFGACIRKLLHNGVVYGGDSAGAIVAGASLRGAEASDEPAFCEQPIYEGLQLIDPVIIPHVDNPDFAEGNELMLRLNEQHETIQLRDDEAYVVSGSKVEVVRGVVAH